jgi:SepF-like predicted cell division protein (DUF552 family)
LAISAFAFQDKPKKTAKNDSIVVIDTVRLKHIQQLQKEIISELRAKKSTAKPDP